MEQTCGQFRQLTFLDQTVLNAKTSSQTRCARYYSFLFPAKQQKSGKFSQKLQIILHSGAGGSDLLVF
jgi:hypothetical protein